MREVSTRQTDIDFIVTWVNGEDPAWRAEKDRYSQVKANDLERGDTRSVRYRPWDTLRYLFRGIEAFAPWVRKVHFVTWGHLPEWLNTNSPKLNIVRHSDYIPPKYLPTFSSRTIEFNFHRIPGLSEHFVNFNDDMMIVSPALPTDFFRDGLPCDSAVLSPFRVMAGDWFYAPVTNNAIIGKYFTARDAIRQHPMKWLNLKYGADMLRTITMLPYPWFYGLMHYHLPDSLLKATLAEVWEKEPAVMDRVCSHRFRVPTDPNQWLFQDWQLAKGEFYPRSPDIGKVFQIRDEDDSRTAATYIKSGKGKLVCINDNLNLTADFAQAEIIVRNALDEVLPERSSFEIPNNRGIE